MSFFASFFNVYFLFSYKICAHTDVQVPYFFEIFIFFGTNLIKQLKKSQTITTFFFVLSQECVLCVWREEKQRNNFKENFVK